jgi:hypothetical protein
VKLRVDGTDALDEVEIFFGRFPFEGTWAIATGVYGYLVNR